MEKEVNIHISGIYGWGKGWLSPSSWLPFQQTKHIEDNQALFEEAVQKACQRMDLTTSQTTHKVTEGRKGATYVYFHPQTIAVKGCVDGAEEVARIIKEELDKSELDIKVSINVLNPSIK
jgi:hypothetical protein